MTEVRQYVVGSRFARTGLVCVAEVAEQIGRLTAPYLSITPGAAERGEWQVVADGQPTSAAVPESVTAQGEVSVDYAVDHDAKMLFHLAPRGPAWVTQSVLRATRAIHRSAASRQGAVFLHAGVVDLGGIGVALVGGSRAGKTSFIMATALSGAGVMVCNDDVSLLAEHDEVVGIGWPRSISVRLDTFDLLFGAGAATRIRASLSHPANQTLLSLKESGAEPHGTALLYPEEYADLLGTTIGRSARVDAVVHLSLADDPSEVDLSPVAPPANEELLAARMLAEANKHLNIFGHEPAAGAPDRTRAALAALPAFRLRYDFRDVRRHVDGLADYLSARLRPAASLSTG
ncbi:hypothetical protein [Kutzneria sp. NPDC052558]|uniref:hypothetical protein n=1 Tax=Kutzneria sp. NPDC052558 TaxID=3364121 RepID=UPI0037C7E4F4